MCRGKALVMMKPVLGAKRRRAMKQKAVVPARWKKEIDAVLISEAQIVRRVRQLASRIEADFNGRDLLVLAMLNGTVLFLADLIRRLALPMRLDFIGISSYREGTKSREVIYTKDLRLDVRGRDVLLIDDILDTGRTLKAVIERVAPLGPRVMKICVLLNKEARRTEAVRADYVGFEIPDQFVVGYGLDFAECYRNLPFIGVLKQHIYKSAEEQK
jgi:hypoxanthine phosphoribosyltransferase